MLKPSPPTKLGCPRRAHNPTPAGPSHCYEVRCIHPRQWRPCRVGGRYAQATDFKLRQHNPWSQPPTPSPQNIHWGPAGGVPGYSMLRNTASGPEIGLPGLILAGLLPGKNRKRPSGRPSAGRRADFGAFPVAKVQQTYGQEGGFPARRHYCLSHPTKGNEAPNPINL